MRLGKVHQHFWWERLMAVWEFLIALTKADGGAIAARQFKTGEKKKDSLYTDLLKLRYCNILSARIGRDGGYWLAIPPEEVTLLLVAEAIGMPKQEELSIQGPSLVAFQRVASSMGRIKLTDSVGEE